MPFSGGEYRHPNEIDRRRDRPRVDVAYKTLALGVLLSGVLWGSVVLLFLAMA